MSLWFWGPSENWVSFHTDSPRVRAPPDAREMYFEMSVVELNRALEATRQEGQPHRTSTLDSKNLRMMLVDVHSSSITTQTLPAQTCVKAVSE
jgi:hypothetical protein